MFEKLIMTTPYGKEDYVLKITNDTNETIAYTFGDILEIDDTYTFSCWMKSNAVTETEINISESSNIEELSDSWDKIVFTAKSNIHSSKEVFFTILPGTTIYAFEGQLEIGTMDTDFSVNPKDTDHKIAQLELTIDGFKTEVSSTYATKEMVSTVDGKFINYSTTVETKSYIDQKAGEINQNVSNNYTTKKEFINKNGAIDSSLSGIETRISSAEENIKPDKIVHTVRNSTEYINDLGEKVNSSEIISSINQTAETVKIDASRIELNGRVTFGMFDSATQGIINTVSSNASNALNDAKTANDQLAEWCYNNDKTIIDGGKIYASSLSAISANLGNITAGNITGVNITGGSITSNTTINVVTDLNVGNNIYINQNVNSTKCIYFNSNNYIQNLYTGSINYISMRSNYRAGLYGIGTSASVAVTGSTYGEGIVDMRAGDNSIQIKPSGSYVYGKLECANEIYATDIYHSTGQYLGLRGNGCYVSAEYFKETGGSQRHVFRPEVDGQAWLGTTSYRWNTGFFTNTITASDLKEKNILNRDMRAKELIMSLNPISYTRHGSGDNGNRIHMGFGAQSVAKSINELKLGDLSLVQASIVDVNGNERPYYGEEMDDNLLSWGINYTELIPPTIAVIQEHDRRIYYLENENARLNQELRNANTKLEAFINGNFELKTLTSEVA